MKNETDTGKKNRHPEQSEENDEMLVFLVGQENTCTSMEEAGKTSEKIIENKPERV